jgi:hypothetical protein
MSSQTATPLQSSDLTSFQRRYRGAGWMNARMYFNSFRVILGIVLLVTLGRYAWMGIIPLTWAAVSFSYDYHLRRTGQGGAAASAAR